MNAGPQPFMWRLRMLACNYCGLTGSIPIQWQNMDNLQALALVNNSLRWAGPVGARRLLSLKLDYNPLAASVPYTVVQLWPSFRQAPMLKTLSMSHSQLSSNLPYGECQHLVR
jgi:Leucine-rich repeat (LRR) protein